MNPSFDFKHSPGNGATLRERRHRMVMFCGAIGLVVMAVVVALDFASVAMHVVSRRTLSNRRDRANVRR